MNDIKLITINLSRIFITLSLLSFILYPKKDAQAFQIELDSTNLPIIIIDTDSQRIVNDVRINAKMKIISNEVGEINKISDTDYNYNGNIAIELRGSSSIMFPKKPYRFETQDSLGNNLNVPLLGLPRENDWILYNPYSDKTLMRNVLTYKMARDQGRYASRTRFCELIIDNEYLGVYVLMEKIKKDKYRVDISDLDSTDLSGDDITGGYIIKIDKLNGENTEGWQSDNIFYQYHYPKASLITLTQKTFIQKFISDFEDVMDESNYSDENYGYLNYIDLDSFVDYFIINEVCRNIDGYRLSAYLFKDKDSKNGKLNMGPVWDFNLALGNASYYSAYDTEGWNLDFLLKNKFVGVPFWWKTLRNDPSFLNKLYYRWNELRSSKLNVDTLKYFINEQVKYLEAAQERNFNKWPIMGIRVWPNWFVGKTYIEEVEFMENWLYERIAWLDNNIKIDTVVSVSDPLNNLVDKQFILNQNYPNPFNPVTTIDYSIHLLSRGKSIVKLEVFNILGEKIRTLVNENQTNGNYRVNFDASDLYSGIYYYRLAVGNYQTIKKMIFLK